MSNLAAAHWMRLPEELRQARQWCIAGPDKAPYMATATGEIVRASSTKPQTWKSFDEVASVASNLDGAGIGFVLTYEDQWTCIDLDVVNGETQKLKGQPIDQAKWTTQAQIERFTKIVEMFDSYTEISKSGYGLHIWVRGRVGAGVKYDGVEVYSQERFMLCTGNVYKDRPVQYQQALLEKLVDEMRTMQGRAEGRNRFELVEIEEEDTDMEIFERAMNAENGDKFRALCEATSCTGEGDNKVHGTYTSLGYPTQSEADLALMSIFTFYSKSNEQCRRLFRCTDLGQREKAVKNDRYLNYTLEVIRGRQARDAAIDESARELAASLVRDIQGTSFSDVAAGQVAVQNIERADVDSTVDWPPGMAGAIAAYIYNSATRPVKEVAIVAALGFLAGVCGKAFNIDQSGLNAYIILVGRSGIGKETMHSGISFICNELRNAIPAASRFVDFTEYQSGPGLAKAVAANPSFVNVSGEWGKRLQRLAQENRPDGPMAQLRTIMTHLYQKSGQDSQVGGMGYSDKEKNTSTISGVAYSMIGETTPETFYQSLTTSMMEDGFLSRFIIVDYTGDRPDRNPNPQRAMHPALAQALHGLCAQALTLISRFSTQHVATTPEAQSLLDAYDKQCDYEIRSTKDEAYRQMWNRAHLKVWRIAALLAASDNWINPIITEEHYHWAHSLISRDIRVMQSRIESGEVGTDDAARDRKLGAVLYEYLEPGPLPEAYGCPPSLKANNLIPRRYMQMRLSRAPQFMSHKGGSTKALDESIRSLMANGFLAEADRGKLVSEHSFHGQAYRIVSLPPVKRA